MTISSRTIVILTDLSLLVLAASGCSEPVKVPTAYTNWSPKDAIYKLDYPEGWKADGGGKQGIQWAEFSKGGCLIKLSTDTSSSVIGDIAQSANTIGTGGEPLSPEQQELLAPVAQVHALKLKDPPEEYGAYKEEGKALAFTSGLGDGRKSVFTASAGVGRRVKGYRVTALGRDKGVTIFCHCPEKEWEKFQPAFDKVLASLAYAN